MSDSESTIYFESDDDILQQAEKKVARKNPISRSQQFKDAVKAEAKKMIKGMESDEDNEPCTSETAKKRATRRKVVNRKKAGADEEEATIKEVAKGRKAGKRKIESDSEEEEKTKKKSAPRGKIAPIGKRQQFDETLSSNQIPRLKTMQSCPYCKLLFHKNTLLEHHFALKHRCKFCCFEGSTNKLVAHIRKCSRLQHGYGVQKHISDFHPFKLVSPMRGYLQTFKLEVDPSPSYELFMTEHKNSVKNVLAYAIEKLGAIKFQIGVWCIFKREILNEVFETTPPRPIYSYQKILYNRVQIKDVLVECYQKVENSINIFETYGSGWILDSVIGISIHAGKFQPILGGCQVKIPPKLYKKKCLVNVKSSGNLCFKYAVLSVLHPTHNSDRVSSYYQYENLYNFDCVEFPVGQKSFSKFEAANQICLNVFTYSKLEGVIPFYISKHNYTNFKLCNLMLLEDYCDHHYVGIRSMSRLLGRHNCHAKQLCYFCMQQFRTKELLDVHILDCKNFEYQKVRLPKTRPGGKAPFLKFKSYEKQLKAGYVVYADFESIQKRKCKVKKLKMRIKSKHVPCGFSYVVVNDKGKIIRKRVYRGRDTVDVFLTDLGRISEIVMAKYLLVKEMDIGEEEEMLHQRQKDCFICKMPFVMGDIKVHDHCHRTGVYRGAAHRECNVNYKQRLTLPVLLHNFQGYDSHIIVQGFKQRGKDFKVIPSNSEKYISITVDNITFLDSLQFLPHSLEKLVNSLKDKDVDNFKILSQCFSHEQCELLKRKGVYPYGYFDSFDRFEETKLPKKSNFFISTKSEHISDSDYEHAQNVFKEFKMKDLGDYHDLYLLSDTLLLSCVFETFRTLCLKYYELDPVHYVSSPGLAWDAALKMTNVKLEQFTDIDMYLFMEKGIRGGISMITKRKSLANNKYMENYDPEKPSKYIMYYDMNNLYGLSLSQRLPVGEFNWLSESEIQSFDIFSTTEEDRYGYAIECTLDYPDHLHDDHNDYCLAVEKIKVPTSNLSPFKKQLLKESSIKCNENTLKLIPHLGRRRKYVVHSANLKYYLEKGLLLPKIHRVLKFRQEAWLAKFIEFNTTKRSLSKSKVESDLFKLLNNSVFGKTMQNNRKHMEVRIVNCSKEAVKLLRSPFFNRYNVICDNLCTFVMQKRLVYLDRAIYAGFATLELSKLHMYKFHYEKMTKWYPSGLQLLMTDTDSLTYEIATDDVYKDMSLRQEHFDFSEYDKSHPLFSEVNKMKLGKMKDEAKGKIIERFVGLGSKAYSMIGTQVSKRSAKGVPRSVTEKLLHHKLFERVIDYQPHYNCSSTVIRSKNHTLTTRVQTKSAIHGFDSKRYLRPCGIKTYAFGHHSIRNIY